MARVISFANQKGGVGKTMSVSATASILTELGQKVLLIDQDAQRNLDMVAGKGWEAEQNGAKSLAISRSDTTSFSILNVLKGQCTMDEAIVPSEIGDLVRSTNQLYGWVGEELLTTEVFAKLRENPEELVDYLDHRQEEEDVKDKVNILRRRLEPVLDRYDYVLIDTNPTLTLLTMNSLYASQFVVIPAFSETSSLEAAVELWDTIQGVKRYSPWIKLEILGILRTKYEQKGLAARRFNIKYKKMEQKTQMPLFKTTIRRTAKASEYVESKMDIVRFDPSCNTSLDYVEFVQELLESIEKTEERWKNNG